MSTIPGGEVPPSQNPGSTPPPPPYTPPAGSPLGYDSGAMELNQEAKTFGMLCHLSALAGFVIPFGNIIGPVVVWMLKKDQHPFVDDQGKESLNFQITVLIAMIVSFILVFIIIGFFLMIAVGLAALVFIIIGAVQASQGQRYRYPVNIRFIK